MSKEIDVIDKMVKNFQIGKVIKGDHVNFLSSLQK